MNLPALAAALQVRLEAQPELGLFLNATDTLIRVGGLDLHGDILIRTAHPESALSMLVAHRQGDRPALDAMMAAAADMLAMSTRAPAESEGLTLLSFLQSETVASCYNQVEFSDRALEDAFGCREYVALSGLRRKLAELNERARRPHDLVGIIWEEYNYRDILAETHANTPHTVLHRGEKVVVGLRKRINTRRGSSLALHFTLRADRRVCVIGALTERPR